MQAEAAGGIGAATRRAGTRLVVGVVVSLAAVAGIVTTFARATKTEAVVWVRAPVALGEVIGRDDLTQRRVSVADGLAAVPASQIDQIVGRVARTALYAGQVLPPQAVNAPAPVAPGEVALTLALGPEQAVGGMIRPGDQVAVLSTSASAPSGSTAAVLPAVTVLSVAPDEGTAGEDRLLVTVRLPAAQVGALQAAYRQGKIDLALVGR